MKPKTPAHLHGGHQGPHRPHAKRLHHTGERKVFDVRRPGRAPAHHTSKPVIVGHKPQIKDPAVSLNGVAQRQPLTGHKKLRLKPAPAAAPSPAAVPPPAPVPVAAAGFEAATPGQLHPPVPPAPAVAPGPPVLDPATVQATTAASQIPGPAPAGIPPQPAPAVDAVPPAPGPAPAPLPPAAAVNAPDAPGPLPAPATPGPTSADRLAHDEVYIDDLPMTLGTTPDDQPEPVISHHVGHKSGPWKTIFLVFVILLLIAAILNILLDGDFLTWNLPHTDFL